MESIKLIMIVGRSVTSKAASHFWEFPTGADFQKSKARFWMSLQAWSRKASEQANEHELLRIPRPVIYLIYQLS